MIPTIPKGAITISANARIRKAFTSMWDAMLKKQRQRKNTQELECDHCGVVWLTPKQAYKCCRDVSQ